MEMVVAYFVLLTRHLPEGSEKNTKTLIQDSRSPGLDLKAGPSLYEAGVLTTSPRRSLELTVKAAGTYSYHYALKGYLAAYLLLLLFKHTKTYLYSFSVV
jgi:hypothetical protein